MFDLFIILFFLGHQQLEFALVLLKRFLQADDPNILGQFGVLFFRLLFERLQLTLNFVHVRFVGVDEVVFMLRKYLNKLVIVI